MRHARALVACALIAMASGCGRNEGGAAGGSDPFQRLVAAAQEPQNWMVHGGSLAEDRFSALDQVNAGNVARLGLAWAYDLDTSRGQEGTPLVIDGVLYTTTAWSKVVAVDAATGRKLWAFDPKVPGKSAYNGCCDVVSRGAAYHDGKIFVATFDGRLIALDAKTGAQVWSIVTVDQSKPYTITGAPRIVKGMVVIGNSGAEFGVRGYVTAYDAATGKQVWRFYTVPGDPAKGPDGAASDEALAKLAAPTWHGEFWKTGGGGTVWDSIVYDAELDQLYIGVGNGTPWNQRLRSPGGGDNLFLSSIVALDPATGKYKWHYQETPGETWDFTATQQMILATLAIDGKPRKVIMHAPKNGFFYVVDRTSGKLISAQPFVPQNWASHIDLATGRPVEIAGARYEEKPYVMTASGAGGHSWQPMSFSPVTGLVYIPAQEIPMLYTDRKGWEYDPRTSNWGIEQNLPLPEDAGTLREIAGSFKGRLLAWDPVRQKAAWSVEYPGPWNGGTLATKGGLVFQGTAQGQFKAYDAANGKLLWQFNAGSGVMAGPISYRVGNDQYVAVLAGYGGAVPLALPEFGGTRQRPPGRILAFRIGGTAQLPKFDPAPAPFAPPSQVFDTALVTRGEALFAYNCSRCHGAGAWSAGVLPDLRRSGVLSDAEAWKQVVLGGILETNGMVSFRGQLSEADAEAVRAYVATQSQRRAGKSDKGSH